MSDNYNNIDDTLKIFDERDKKRRAEKENQELFNMVNNKNNSIEIVDKMKKDTIGSEKKTSTSKKKKTNRKLNWKAIILALIIGFGLGVVSGHKIVNTAQEVGERIEFHRDVNFIIDELKQDALIKLEMNGFDLDRLWIYNAEDFAKLNVSNPMEVYIFHEVLDSEGFVFAEFIKSISFERVSTFSDFQQFLRYYGYVNPKTGEPSSVVFENMIEAEIKDTYEKYGASAIITGIDDILGNSQGRGAR